MYDMTCQIIDDPKFSDFDYHESCFILLVDFITVCSIAVNNNLFLQETSRILYLFLNSLRFVSINRMLFSLLVKHKIHNSNLLKRCFKDNHKMLNMELENDNKKINFILYITMLNN